MKILPVWKTLRASASGLSVRQPFVASVERNGDASCRRHSAFRSMFRRNAMWMSAALGVAVSAALLPGAAVASTGCAALNLSGHTTGSGTAVGPSPSGTYASGDIVTYTITSFSGGTGYQQLNTQSASAVTGHDGGTGTYYYTIPSAGSYQFTAVDGSPVANGATEQIYFTLVCNSAPVPTVTAVTPASGYTNGGTTVTINGTNFAPGTPAFNANSVKFGGVAASSFTIISSTQITAVVPAVTSAQTVDVTVSNNTYTSAASASDHFTYTGAAPVPNCLPYDTTAKVAEVIDFSSVGNSASLVKTFYNTNGATNCETQNYGLYTAAQNGGSTTVPSDGYSDESDMVAATTTITGAGGSTITLTGTSNSAPAGFDYDQLTVKVGSTNGLTTDTYTVYVTTNGATVNSSIKFVVNFAPVATVPGAPTIGTATAGNGSATVNFTAPASNGGATITSYTVTSSPGGFTGSGTSSPITVSGLTNGTPYTFTVKANNSVGASAASAASNSVTPVTTPGTPTIGTATAGNASATVAFTPPASNGGSAITSYTVTSNPGNYTASGTGSPITVSGLTNGTAYTFTVFATNSVGNGPNSSVSNSVTPSTVPGAPTIGTATGGNASAMVAFTAPANGGSAITLYTATSSPGNITASATASPITVGGLTNGTSYTFTVYATNSRGNGPASAVSNSVTPAVPPVAATATGSGTVLPTTAVGSTAAQTAIAFNITSTGTLGPPQVLTQGAANLDFTLGTGSTCTGSTAGACQINVLFAPMYPGQRLGAVNLTDAGGAVIATAYISGTGTGPLATFTPGVISTVAGSGNPCTSGAANCGDGGSATASTALINAVRFALDSSGNLYIADQNDGRVRKVTAATGLLSTIAGNGATCSPTTAACGDGAAATSAQLVYPQGVAVDGAGNIYIADSDGERVRKVSASTGIITTVAGTGTVCSPSTATCGDGGSATASGANLNAPSEVTLDGAGNLYIADQLDNRIREVNAATNVITTVAGNGTACASGTAVCGDGAAATAANLNSPGGLAVDSAGNIYIGDQFDNRIRKVTVATGLISTVAGSGTACSSKTAACGDGGSATAAGAQLSLPLGIRLDPAGNLYIADQTNYRIRKLTISTGLLSTVAGSGNQCASTTAVCGDGDFATASAADIGYPASIALDGAGNLYVDDDLDNRIRKVTTTAGIIFPTATAAGSVDTADGTQAAILNNIGNASLTLASMANTNSNFLLGNPNTGGCSTAVPVAAGGSCILGEVFTPAAGSSGVVAGALAVNDNSLNVSGSQQYVLLSGTTTAGAVTVSSSSNTVPAGTVSVTFAVVVSYSGAAADTGAVTLTVGGSATGVSTPVCMSKGAHKNCTFTYTGTALATGGSYPVAVAVAADATDGYSAASATANLYVTTTH